MSHTVTITKLPDDTSDDWEYTFGGEHSQECSVWDGCNRAACVKMNPDYPPGDERFRHGKLHEYRDGEWLIETDKCALRFVFEHGGIEDAFDGLSIGTYPVTICWEDTWWLEVQGGL